MATSAAVWPALFSASAMVASFARIKRHAAASASFTAWWSAVSPCESHSWRASKSDLARIARLTSNM
eukprot:Skav226524  [mRNA]  locus=scaffold1773:222167:226729:+ [translate_table: standard]